MKKATQQIERIEQIERPDAPPLAPAKFDWDEFQERYPTLAEQIDREFLDKSGPDLLADLTWRNVATEGSNCWLFWRDKLVAFRKAKATKVLKDGKENK